MTNTRPPKDWFLLDFGDGTLQICRNHRGFRTSQIWQKSKSFWDEWKAGWYPVGTPCSPDDSPVARGWGWKLAKCFEASHRFYWRLPSRNWNLIIPHLRMFIHRLSVGGIVMYHFSLQMAKKNTVWWSVAILGDGHLDVSKTSLYWDGWSFFSRLARDVWDPFAHPGWS